MRDLKIEQWLRQYKLEYQYREDFPLKQVVVDTRAKEQIRLTATLDDDMVQRYALAMEAGEDFPGIVVYRLDPAKGDASHVGMINGWHRTEAYTLVERVTIPAYVVQLEPDNMGLLSLLRRTVNLLEGKPPSVAEMMEHAIWLVRSGGYTQTDAARLARIPSKRLNERMLYEDMRERLAKVGLSTDELGNLPISGVARMSRVRDRELRIVAQFANEARLSVADIRQLATDVSSAGSDEAADRVLQRWRTRYADRIHESKGGTVRPPSSAIRRLPQYLAAVERAISAKDTQALETLAPEALRLLAAAIERTVDRLQQTLTIIKRMIAAHEHARVDDDPQVPVSGSLR